MNKRVIIRNALPEDGNAITKVTIAAFKTLAISRHTEQFVIQELRAAKALTLSMVAEMDGLVIGHIAFSPVKISDGTPGWYGLGPVSVLPEYQRKGVGKRLIEEGLSRLKGLNASGCCLVGFPEYYKKFGFENQSGFSHEGCRPSSFSPWPFPGIFLRGRLLSTKRSKQRGKTLQENTADNLQVDFSFGLNVPQRSKWV